MPRVGSSSASTAGSVLAVGDDREREPLALAAGEVAGVAVLRAPQAGAGERTAESLAVDALVQEVVAGVLQQQRDAPAALRSRPRVGSSRPAAWRSSVDLPAPLRPISATLSPGLARAGRRRAGSPARADLVPDAAQLERPASGAADAPAREPACAGSVRARLWARRHLVREAPRPAARRWRSAARACLTPTGGGLQTGEREELGAGRLQRGLGAGGPLQEARAASPSWAMRPSRTAITRSAPERQRSRRCSASRIVVSDSWLRRRSSAISSSPATGSSWEVGSSSSSRRGPPGEGGAERDALLLAAGELVGGAVEQVVDAERERDLLDAARDRRGAVAAALQRERELGAHRAHHELRLGILEERAGERAEARGPVLARVEPGERRRDRRSCPPWKCGTSPQAARSSVDLPCPESPASRQNSPGSSAKLTSCSAGALDAWVGVGDAARRSRTRPITARSRGGRRTAAATASASAAQSASRPGLSGHVQQRIGGEGGQCRPAARAAQARARPRRRRRRRGRAATRAAAGAARGGGGREAAHLERRGDVHRAVERAGDDGAEQRGRDARARARAPPSGPGALRLGEPLGVGGEQRAPCAPRARR